MDSAIQRLNNWGLMFMILCSDALARLKERIKQQKEQASRLSPTDTAQGKAVTELLCT